MIEVTIKDRRTGVRHTFNVESAMLVTCDGDDVTLCVVGEVEEDEGAVCEALRVAHESVVNDVAQTPIH